MPLHVRHKHERAAMQGGAQVEAPERADLAIKLAGSACPSNVHSLPYIMLERPMAYLPAFHRVGIFS